MDSESRLLRSDGMHGVDRNRPASRNYRLLNRLMSTSRVRHPCAGMARVLLRMRSNTLFHCRPPHPTRRLSDMKRIVLSLVVLLAVALPIHAQLATGNIYGTVTDESGAALPGAAVTVKGPGGTFTTIAGSDGRFRVLNLAPGAYQLTAALAGFATVTRDHVVVATGANV